MTLKRVVLISNSAYFVTHYLVFFIFLTLSFPLALASSSRNWPQPHSPGLGLKILVLFNISGTEIGDKTASVNMKNSSLCITLAASNMNEVKN